MRELKKEEIEQLKNWADKKIKSGSKSEEIKELIKERYGEKNADLVFGSELESDVSWLKGYVEKKKKEEEVQTYTHLISYALISLFTAAAFWYSAIKMGEAMQELGSIGGFAGIDILGKTTTALWIGVALGILFFIGFTLAFIFKKYKIYGKDLKKKNVP